MSGDFGPKAWEWVELLVVTPRTLGVSLSSLGLSLPFCRVGMGCLRKSAPSQMRCPSAWPAVTVLTPPLPPLNQALSQGATPSLFLPHGLKLNAILILHYSTPAISWDDLKRTPSSPNLSTILSLPGMAPTIPICTPKQEPRGQLDLSSPPLHLSSPPLLQRLPLSPSQGPQASSPCTSPPRPSHCPQWKG